MLRQAANVARILLQAIVYLLMLTRNSLKYTRAILDAIHSGDLANAEYETYETFNLNVPKSCANVPDELLNPARSWAGTTAFKDEVTKLGKLFNENFEKYASEATDEVIKAGMQLY